MGQIVGTLIDSSGAQDGFLASPTIITAVQEPASIALLAGSIGVLAWTGRRRAWPD